MTGPSQPTQVMSKIRSKLGGAPAPSVEFANLTFTVKLKSGGNKVLLKGVSGVCAAAKLTALMGPSGSGKTTLLDTLAGCAFGGTISGDITVNKKPIDLWAEKGGCASYVMQQDVLPIWDTPREALTTAALLRLPGNLTKDEKLERVEELLDILELTHCADLQIGDSSQGMRGLSGGQRRRVTIGIEVVKDPSLIFLDEPLTGLDSEMSEQVAGSLKRLVRQGKTIILSLHTPGRTIEDFMDNLILLAAGNVTYWGPFSGGPKFLESLGHKPTPSQSQSEFMLSVMKDPEAAAAAAEAFTQRQDGSPKRSLKDGSDDVEAQMGSTMSKKGTAKMLRNATTLVDVYNEGDKPAASIHYQFWVLTKRNARWMKRERGSNLVLVGSALFTGILLGLIFWNISDDLEEGSRARMSVLWMVITMVIFFYCHLAISSWEKIRLLTKRECDTHLYHLASWYLARCLQWLLIIPVLGLVFSVCYPMIQLQQTFVRYIIFLALGVLLGYTTDLLGLVIAFIAPDGPSAIGIQSAVGMLLVSCTGFLTPSLPVYLRWVQESSFVTFAYTALILNEFHGLELTATITRGNYSISTTHYGLPSAIQPTHASWGLGGNIGMLAAIYGAFLIVGYVTMVAMHKLKML